MTRFEVQPPRPREGSVRPRRADVLLAAAMAFGSARAEHAAIEAAQDQEDLAPRFACEPQTKTLLCELADGRTVPALLKHQVVNAIDKLHRTGLLPDHLGVSARAISDVLGAVASFDTSGLGAAVSQRRIARRAKYSVRHVRDVLRYAVDAGFVERCPRWAAADRTPSGALEPVTDDRETVYVVHLLPRDIARGASDELLLDVASPADPPLRVRLPERGASPHAIAAGRGSVVESASEGSTDRSGGAQPPEASAPSGDTERAQKPATPPPASARALAPALQPITQLVDRIAALTGIHLDPIDVATLGTAQHPNGYGLPPERVLEAMTELHEKIRDGECVPRKDDPSARWSARNLRGRAASFLRAKRDRVARNGEPTVTERDRLRREAAAREEEYERRKAREATEWEARAAARSEDTCTPAVCEPATRSSVPTPAWLIEHCLARFRRELDTCDDPARAVALRREIEELKAERGPP